eukprot:comp16271_c0_seq1/m.14026 comp16271_c0_seq1/g.14026  ORF comp16271_c0_seq1/g.14026 comp16271_c0_seq1/m.14026 type:complete len:791 (-) comp16271_c0_seq1:31-2403(-)
MADPPPPTRRVSWSPGIFERLGAKLEGKSDGQELRDVKSAEGNFMFSSFVATLSVRRGSLSMGVAKAASFPSAADTHDDDLLAGTDEPPVVAVRGGELRLRYPNPPGIDPAMAEALQDRMDYARETERLILSSMGLTTIPVEVLELDYVTVVDLSHNRLSELPHALVEMASLQIVNLAHNTFTVFPAVLCFLTGLRALNLSHNYISELPTRVSSLTALEALSLDNNKFSKFPSEVCLLRQLSDLGLSSNSISTLPPVMAQLAPTLTNLRLNVNRLSEVSDGLGLLTRLTRLHLDTNRLSVLPHATGNLTALVELSVSNNRLCVLPPTIARLINLTVLDVANNHLVELPLGMAGLRRLVHVGLEGNRWGQPLCAYVDQGWELAMEYLEEMQLAEMLEPMSPSLDDQCGQSPSIKVMTVTKEGAMGDIVLTRGRRPDDVMVAYVPPGSGYVAAGLTRGDNLFVVGGEVINTITAAKWKLERIGSGGVSTVVYTEGARKVVVDIPTSRLKATLGLQLHPSQMEANGRAYLGVVVTHLWRGSPLARAGLQVGDALLYINTHPISSVAQAWALLSGLKRMTLLVESNMHTHSAQHQVPMSTCVPAADLAYTPTPMQAVMNATPGNLQMGMCNAQGGNGQTSGGMQHKSGTGLYPGDYESVHGHSNPFGGDAVVVEGQDRGMGWLDRLVDELQEQLDEVDVVTERVLTVAMTVEDTLHTMVDDMDDGIDATRDQPMPHALTHISDIVVRRMSEVADTVDEAITVLPRQNVSTPHKTSHDGSQNGVCFRMPTTAPMA